MSDNIPDVPDNYKPLVDKCVTSLARAGDELMPVMEELSTTDDHSFRIEGNRCVVTVEPIPAPKNQ